MPVASKNSAYDDMIYLLGGGGVREAGRGREIPGGILGAARTSGREEKQGRGGEREGENDR